MREDTCFREIAIRDEKINDLEKRLNLNSTSSHSALQKINQELRLQNKEKKEIKSWRKTIKTPSQGSEFVDRIEHKPQKCEMAMISRGIKSKIYDTDKKRIWLLNTGDI